jgi:hypothetical protein
LFFRSSVPVLSEVRAKTIMWCIRKHVSFSGCGRLHCTMFMSILMLVSSLCATFRNGLLLGRVGGICCLHFHVEMRKMKWLWMWNTFVVQVTIKSEGKPNVICMNTHTSDLILTLRWSRTAQPTSTRNKRPLSSVNMNIEQDLYSNLVEFKVTPTANRLSLYYRLMVMTSKVSRPTSRKVHNILDWGLEGLRN